MPQGRRRGVRPGARFEVRFDHEWWRRDLRYLGFGERHPQRDQQSVDELAHRWLHG